jgi:hypothetical protein
MDDKQNNNKKGDEDFSQVELRVNRRLLLQRLDNR